MKTQTYIFSAAFVIVAVAAGVAWNQARSRREIELSLADLVHTRSNGIDEMRGLGEHVVGLEKDLSSLKSALDQIKNGKKNPPAGDPSNPALPAARSFSPLAAIMNDPKLQNLFFAAQRANLTTTYGPFFRRVGLSTEQIAKFQDIMIKREEQKMDLLAAARSQGLSPDSHALATLQQQTENEISTAQAQLLGPEAYAQWQQFERSAGVRSVTQNFSGAAAIEAMPLTSQQAEQLTQVLAEESVRYRNGGKADFGDVDWDSADRKLVNVLSEDQLRLFQSIEPIGGGPSRFSARLNSTFQTAAKMEATNSNAQSKHSETK